MKKHEEKFLKSVIAGIAIAVFLPIRHYNSVAETLKTYAKSYFLESS